MKDIREVIMVSKRTQEQCRLGSTTPDKILGADCAIGLRNSLAHRSSVTDAGRYDIHEAP